MPLLSSGIGWTAMTRAVMFLLRQQDVVTFRKVSQCISKGKVPVLHDKAEDVSAASAPEAVIELILRIHVEGWSLLLVKRAQP